MQSVSGVSAYEFKSLTLACNCWPSQARVLLSGPNTELLTGLSGVSFYGY